MVTVRTEQYTSFSIEVIIKLLTYVALLSAHTKNGLIFNFLVATGTPALTATIAKLHEPEKAGG